MEKDIKGSHFVIILHFKDAVVACVFPETMLGRHVKPGSGRKRKRAAWPSLPHLLGQTRKQEPGKGGWAPEGQRGEKGENCEGRERYEAHEAKVCSVIGTHHKVAAEVVLSPLVVPLAHGLHRLDKLSQDAGLLHPSAVF